MDSSNIIIRDQAWLEDFFVKIWEDHFSEVEGGKPIQIIWGRRARTRLGSLSYDDRKGYCVVRITRYYQEVSVPDFVIKATIVHELCHYAHGFHSGLPPQHKYPHQGGVIRREFAERNLENLYVRQRRWLRQNWRDIVLGN